MTPTMSEYFEAWKNSRFVAGEQATEKAFVVASRLQDITDILGGLVLIYDNVAAEHRERPTPSRRARRRAALDALHDFAARPARPGGRRASTFDAQDADTLGSRGAGPGRGDRRPGLAGRRPAEHRARDLSRGRGSAVRPGALAVARGARAARGARRCRGAARRRAAPWRAAEASARAALRRPDAS